MNTTRPVLAALAVMLVVLTWPTAASAQQPQVFRGAPIHPHIVVEEYPHDRNAYTQGLLIHDGRLFESTGKYGHSSVREVDLASGDVLRKKRVSPLRFAEGLVCWGDQLIQLTWRGGEGYVYDLESFDREGEFAYTGEGWGLTADQDRLIMSDGTSTLRFLDPTTLTVTGTLDVWDAMGPLDGLNELEMVRGELWANVFPSDLIARIDLDTGEVIGWMYLRDDRMRISPGSKAEVLNGIAWDADSDRVYVTGKYWPVLMEIEVFFDE